MLSVSVKLLLFGRNHLELVFNYFSRCSFLLGLGRPAQEPHLFELILQQPHGSHPKLALADPGAWLHQP